MAASHVDHMAAFHADRPALHKSMQRVTPPPTMETNDFMATVPNVNPSTPNDTTFTKSAPVTPEKRPAKVGRSIAT